MKKFSYCRDAASKGAALMLVLAFVVLLTGMALAYFSRTTADRQLAHSSYSDTSSDLLARSALDIIVSDFKQELLPPNPNPPTAPQVTRSNIQPQRSGDDASIPNLIRRSVYPDTIGSRGGVSSLASAISSGPADPNNPQRGEIKSARWNSHYLVPRSTTDDSIVDSTPISNFTPPDWVLVTRNGPVAFSGWNNNLKDPSSANYVVGRYAFAVYDEGGLLPMNLAGYPSWSNSLPCFANPAPTPWLVNVGRKGTVAFADLTALGSSAPSPTVIDNLVGWRNYAMTKRTFTNFPTGIPGFATDDCTKADFYGSYLLYFGDPPFAIESLADNLAASIYPFTSAAANVWNGRTDQAFVSRQQLLKLRSSLGLSQNVLQYMGTFSRERNRPAADWSPDLAGSLSEGRFNLNNLALVVPNPADCVLPHGKKRGWLTGKNRNHLCGTPEEIIELFGLFWVTAETLDNTYHIPGHWTYIQNTGPNPPGNPDPNPQSIICFRGRNQQNDFFQILHYALNVGRPDGADRCAGSGSKDRTFAIGASLIDQYDSGADCDNYLPANWSETGCDLDSHVVTHNGGNRKYATHTTVIRYGQGSTGSSFGYGMEPNNRNPDPCPPCDSINGDRLYEANPSGNDPHRPQDAPVPIATTQVISHAFSNVGELGYGIDTLAAGRPTLDFSSPDFPDAPVLDFFSYNPISSAYPRAGIVNLYTRNAPVLAAMLSQTLQTDAAANVNPPSPVLSQSQAMTAATAIVQETQSILSGSTSHTDLTRAVAARLAARGGSALGWSYTTEREKMESVARALAEMGQTRTWNLMIDVIAQTGHYAPNAQGLTDFIPEGEKRYWLHIALGRDLIHTDGTPCVAGDTGCQVDVLGTQLEEVVD